MKFSAGILMYRIIDEKAQVLLVHPGGPFWKNRDAGAWSIPKGEYDPAEDPLAAAKREFFEETGCMPEGRFIRLPGVRQKGGKQVSAWTLSGDLDASRVRSNTFEMEWPPRSGKRARFPEIDRAEWFDLETAREKILPGQVELINALERVLQDLPG